MFVLNKRHLVSEEQRPGRALPIEQLQLTLAIPLSPCPSQEDGNILKRKQRALHDWFATASGALETASSASSLGCFGGAVMFNCNMVRLASQINLPRPVEPLPPKHWR